MMMDKRLTKKDIIGGKKYISWCDDESGEHGIEYFNGKLHFQEVLEDLRYTHPETLEWDIKEEIQAISLSRLREVVKKIQNDTNDCFTGLTKDDDWQEGACCVLKQIDDLFGEVMEG